MIYTLTFNPALDYVINLDRLLVGKTNRTNNECILFGGKGINVSATLKQLGRLSVALGYTAGFTGDALEKLLEDNGICTDFIQLEQGLTRINVKIKDDHETEINATGPEIDTANIDKLYKRLSKLCGGDILVLSGSVPQNVDRDIYQNIMQKLAKKKVLFVVDAAGELLLNTLQYKPFLIKPNKQELMELFDLEQMSDDDIKTYAYKLKEKGAVNVLVSLGDKGSILVDKTGFCHQCGTVAGKAINSVGAGDAMIAGFINGYLERGDYQYALKLGTACGAATAFSLGNAPASLIKDILLKL